MFVAESEYVRYQYYIYVNRSRLCACSHWTEFCLARQTLSLDPATFNRFSFFFQYSNITRSEDISRQQNNLWRRQSPAFVRLKMSYLMQFIWAFSLWFLWDTFMLEAFIRLDSPVCLFDWNERCDKLHRWKWQSFPSKFSPIPVRCAQTMQQ